MNVGFIGLGRMGNHMARNLAEKGHKVTVFDIRPDVVAQVSEIPGITGAKTVRKPRVTPRSSGPRCPARRRSRRSRWARVA